MSDKRAVEGASPYEADERPPVGAIHESPADLRPCPTSGLSRAPAPTKQTNVPPKGRFTNRPQTCAHVRQAGCRGRQPLRSRRTSLRRGDPCGRPQTCARVRQAGCRGRQPLRNGRTFPVSRTMNFNPSRCARHHNYSLFIFHSSFTPPATACDSLRRGKSRRSCRSCRKRDTLSGYASGGQGYILPALLKK